MKILSWLIFTTLLFSCGKASKTNTSTSNDFLQQQRWNLLDDDGDGYSNQDEISRGSSPEILNPPDFNNFKLINVGFISQERHLSDQGNYISFEVDENSLNHYFFKKFSPQEIIGKLPYQNLSFDKEHLSINVNDSFPSPQEFVLIPKIDSFFAKHVSNLLLSDSKNKSDQQKIDPIIVNLTLNFPSELTLGPWQEIQGEIKWGEKIIPWHWSKKNEPKIHWQIDLDFDEFSAIMLKNKNIYLKILSWSFSTPFGIKKIDQTTLNKYIPFFVLNSSKNFSGWYDPSLSLPAAKIVQRPSSEKKESFPWLFFKVQSITTSQSSYWLKEVTPAEETWLKSGKLLIWKLDHSPQNEDFLPLPPHSSIRGLKITAHHDKYPIHTPQNKRSSRNLAPCLVQFIYPDGETVSSDYLNLNRLLFIFQINSYHLENLRPDNFYYTFEKDESNNELISLTLYWSEHFKWSQFSLWGLANETKDNSFPFVDNCSLSEVAWENVIYNNPLPIYKSEIFTFEWLF